MENFKHPPTCGPKKCSVQMTRFGLDGGQENCCLDGPVRWQNGLLMLPKCENPFKNSHSDDKFPLFSHLKDPECKQDQRKWSNKITFKFFINFSWNFHSFRADTQCRMHSYKTEKLGSASTDRANIRRKSLKTVLETCSVKGLSCFQLSVEKVLHLVINVSAQFWDKYLRK